VPVAAPSSTLVRASVPSCLRLLPAAEGNWAARGCCAGPRSDTAGGGPGADAGLVAEVELDAAGAEAFELVDDDEDPQPVRARRAAIAAKSAQVC
jgi:hypothetical protein